MSDRPSRRAIRYLSRRDYRHIINKDTTEAGDHWSRLFQHYAHQDIAQDTVMPWVMRKAPIEVTGGWTVSTLLEYINARISDMELRNQQRFEAQIDASNSRSADMELRQQQRFEAQTKAIEAAITAQRTAIDAALIAANQATAKSEVATEIRFVGITNAQNAITEQISALITRKEAEAMGERNAERIRDLTTRLQVFVPRDVVMTEYDRISTQVQDIADRLTRSEGKGAGINALWVYILGAVAAVGTLVSLYVAYK